LSLEKPRDCIRADASEGIEPATRMEIIRLMSFLSFAWAVAGETIQGSV